MRSLDSSVKLLFVAASNLLPSKLNTLNSEHSRRECTNYHIIGYTEDIIINIKILRFLKKKLDTYIISNRRKFLLNWICIIGKEIFLKRRMIYSKIK